jgi:hypothetical protein
LGSYLGSAEESVGVRKLVGEKKVFLRLRRDEAACGGVERISSGCVAVQSARRSSERESGGMLARAHAIEKLTVSVGERRGELVGRRRRRGGAVCWRVLVAGEHAMGGLNAAAEGIRGRPRERTTAGGE